MRICTPAAINAKWQQAVDNADQHQANLKAKRENPIPAPIAPDTPPVPENLDSVLDDLLENNGDNVDITEAAFAFLSRMPDPNDPRSTPAPEDLSEAFRGPDAEKWRAALNEELNNLKQNNVHEVVEIPDSVKPITSKPVMKIKLDKDGNIERFKLRIIACRFKQKAGVDYSEMFAPVANLESIQIICALAAKYDLELDQMDVSTAYLNSVLDEDIYLSPLVGVPIADGFCWKLKRSIYGLKQAGHTWNRTLDKALIDIGFQCLDAETCLYVFRSETREVCFLVVYVDDLLLAASTKSFMREIKAKLTGKFKMRDLGAASFLLGIEIKRNRTNRTISLSQGQYIDKVLEHCGMQDCNPSQTPMATHPHITSDDPEDNTVHQTLTIGTKSVLYPTIIGSLMYAMLGTHPDLAYVVGVLGRYASAPKLCHWEVTKRALCYLKHTRSMELCFQGSDIHLDMDFHGYSDADWCRDTDTSQSTSGFVFISNGAAISYPSKRQTMVALSSTKSEYVGLSNAGQHLAWLRRSSKKLDTSRLSPPA